MTELPPVEAIQPQKFPITPKGILAAEETFSAIRDNKSPAPDFERMSEHEIPMYVLRPGYERKTIQTENGKQYTFLVRESIIKGKTMAESRVYIGGDKLPQDMPFESTVIYRHDAYSESHVTLNRYQGTELDSNGNEVPRDIISFEDGRYEQVGYNVHFQTHGLPPEYAKELADKMGIPPQTSMW